MEPIVAVLRVDRFILGRIPGPKTWPTGTLIKIIPRVDSTGKEIRRPTGEQEIEAMPVCCAEYNGTTTGPSYTLQASDDGGALPFGRFIHPPNTRGVTRGCENVIYFTPPVPYNDLADVDPAEALNTGNRFVILAEPITVGGPGDVVTKSTIPYSDLELDSCGPKYLSAAVGGVVALDWDSYTYPNTLKLASEATGSKAASLERAFAGSPVYIKQTIPNASLENIKRARKAAFTKTVTQLSMKQKALDEKKSKLSGRITAEEEARINDEIASLEVEKNAYSAAISAIDALSTSA